MEQVRNFFRTTAGKIIAAIVGVFLVLVLISSCSRPTTYAGIPQQQYMQPAPVVQQMPAQAAGGAPVIVNNGGGGSGGSHFGETLLGSALGSAAGSYIGNKMAQPTTSPYSRTEQYVTTTAPAQRYAAPAQTYSRPAAPVYQKPTTTTTSSRQGYSTTTKTTSSGRTSISTGRTSGRR